MKEQQIGKHKVEFTTDTTTDDPDILCVFGPEHSGKTRLALSGPDGIGAIVTEMKSFRTLDKDARDLGKTVFKPKDPTALMAVKRRVDSMAKDVDKQIYYKDLCEKIEDTSYALLEHSDVRLVMIDKFTQYCKWKEWAINGMGENFAKIEGKLVQRKAEVVQGIIDFITALGQFHKPVLFLCGSRPDFDVVDSDKKSLRDKEDCGHFYYMGSHVNLTVETQSNPVYRPDKKGSDWRYRLNVRQAQIRPELQGPSGNPLLYDDDISLARLMLEVQGDKFQPDMWM